MSAQADSATFGMTAQRLCSVDGFSAGRSRWETEFRDADAKESPAERENRLAHMTAEDRAREEGRRATPKGSPVGGGVAEKQADELRGWGTAVIPTPPPAVRQPEQVVLPKRKSKTVEKAGKKEAGKTEARNTEAGKTETAAKEAAKAAITAAKREEAGKKILRNVGHNKESLGVHDGGISDYHAPSAKVAHHTAAATSAVKRPVKPLPVGEDKTPANEKAEGTSAVKRPVKPLPVGEDKTPVNEKAEEGTSAPESAKTKATDAPNASTKSTDAEDKKAIVLPVVKQRPPVKQLPPVKQRPAVTQRPAVNKQRPQHFPKTHAEKHVPKVQETRAPLPNIGKAARQAAEKLDKSKIAAAKTEKDRKARIDDAKRDEEVAEEQQNVAVEEERKKDAITKKKAKEKETAKRAKQKGKDVLAETAAQKDAERAKRLEHNEKAVDGRYGPMVSEPTTELEQKTTKDRLARAVSQRRQERARRQAFQVLQEAGKQQKKIEAALLEDSGLKQRAEREARRKKRHERHLDNVAAAMLDNGGDLVEEDAIRKELAAQDKVRRERREAKKVRRAGSGRSNLAQVRVRM